MSISLKVKNRLLSNIEKKQFTHNPTPTIHERSYPYRARHYFGLGCFRRDFHSEKQSQRQLFKLWKQFMFRMQQCGLSVET